MSTREDELRLNVSFENIPCVHIKEIAESLGYIKHERIIMWPNGFRIVESGKCDRKIVKNRKYVYLNKTFFKWVTSMEYPQSNWPTEWHKSFSISACLDSAVVKVRFILASLERVTTSERISISYDSLSRLNFEYECEMLSPEWDGSLELFDKSYKLLKKEITTLCKLREYKSYEMQLTKFQQADNYIPVLKEKFIFKREKFGSHIDLKSFLASAAGRINLSKLTSSQNADFVFSFKIDGIYGVAKCFKIVDAIWKMCAQFEDMMEYSDTVLDMHFDFNSITFQVERVGDVLVIIDVLKIDDIQIIGKPTLFYLEFMNNFKFKVKSTKKIFVQKYYTTDIYQHNSKYSSNDITTFPTDGIIIVKDGTTYRVKEQNSYELQYCGQNIFCDLEGNIYNNNKNEKLDIGIYETFINKTNVVVLRPRPDRHYPNSVTRINRETKDLLFTKT